MEYVSNPFTRVVNGQSYPACLELSSEHAGPSRATDAAEILRFPPGREAYGRRRKGPSRLSLSPPCGAALPRAKLRHSALCQTSPPGACPTPAPNPGRCIASSSPRSQTTAIVHFLEFREKLSVAALGVSRSDAESLPRKAETKGSQIESNQLLRTEAKQHSSRVLKKRLQLPVAQHCPKMH